ncbi:MULTISPECIES: EspA/EspE family type VII secretion system effector [unclassified Mycolicibacterium]|uniref:EspA/EspE family type VII secretion system effector n=1 Tax=unclassified Mycolicibacterium TaxID=2636767 RepID=UPI002EDAAD2F
MSALDAFYSTWDQARTTFGSGPPQTGAEFDRSSQLRDMQSAVQAATPDSRWQGSAADAYTAKNEKHAAVYGKLADLDQRMAAEVDRSAAVVTAGRQNLDQVRDWVTNAAASAPNDKSGEYAKLAIASKGLSQISDIIQQSNSEMSAIGERVRGIGKEYDEIGGDDKKNAFGGDKSDRWKQNPPPVTGDDNRTQDDKIAEWYVKWNALVKELADLGRSIPPPTAPESVGNEYNRKKNELMKKVAEMAQEGAELGLEVDGYPPPTSRGVTSDSTTGRAPLTSNIPPAPRGMSGFRTLRP